MVMLKLTRYKIHIPYALNSDLICSELVPIVGNTEYEEDLKPMMLNATCNSESDGTDDENRETISCLSNDSCFDFHVDLSK